MNLWRAVLLVPQFPPAQAQPRTGTASVERVVVQPGRDEPRAGVDVELTDQNPAPAQNSNAGVFKPSPNGATSSADPGHGKIRSDGRFAFRNLPSGAYKLVAAHIGGAWGPVEYADLYEQVVSPVFGWEDVDKNLLVDQDFIRLYETSGTAVRMNAG